MAVIGDLGLVIGAVAVIFFAAYFFFQLMKTSGTEHHFLQLLMIGFIISGLFVLGGGVLQVSQGCEWVKANNSVVETENVSGKIVVTEETFSYKEQCRDEPTGFASALHLLVVWMARLFFIYIFLRLIFELLRWFGYLPEMWK